MRAGRTRVVALAVALAAVGLSACGGGDSAADAVARGDELFHGEATCATCHGPDLRGTVMGPPLLSPIYAPDHHPDDAIRNAVAQGVTPHHWDFGPMPPLAHLDDDDVDALIAFIRDRQRAEGIE